MTENKRFTLNEDRIKDNQSPCCYIEYYKGLIPIVDLLNELAEENNELKKENEQLKDLIILMGYTIKNENGTITLELKQ